MSRKRKQEKALDDKRNSTASLRLRSYVERIERVLGEIDELRQDIKAIKAEAGSEGYDVKTINRLIKLRKLTPEERQEEDALLDLYKAALGMLDGTPLGRAARERLKKDRGEDGGREQSGGAASGDDPPADDDESGDEASGDNADDDGFPPEEMDKARAAGAAAARGGARVLDNPYVADDPRRAAWDEGWCQETGSDGMDLPDAWRPKPKKKPDDGEGGAQ